jgi:SAM-dependent methyltransferase
MVSSVLCSVLNCQATILDPSPDELKVAAMQGHKTICALLEDMKPNDQRYDLVFCCQTIDHFFNLKESLEKMRNALDHNGFLFIDIIDFDSAWKLKSCIEHVIKIDHCYYLSSENAPLILKSVGLEPVFSEISSHIEHVSYICRPCKPVESFYHLDSWIRSRTRSMQNARINFHMMPDGIPGWRKLAYKLKKIILRGFLSRFC